MGLGSRIQGSKWHRIPNPGSGSATLVTIFSNFNFFFRFEETKEPYRCCGKADCVSLTDRVTKLLDPEVLEIMIGLRYRDKADNSELKPESFRYSAYRNLVVLTYGRTRAKKKRLPLPSCLVMRVRRQYPDPDHHYTGFQVKRSRKR